MMPYAGIDANFIGCTLVTQLYSLIGMKVPPLEGATLVIYYINGGLVGSKVSDHFELKGSVRTTTVDSFQVLKSTITKLAEGLCSAYGATSKVTLELGKFQLTQATTGQW
jgi:metal-dependent amidase/aminoacylase/carboxypeptidase family protein